MEIVGIMPCKGRPEQTLRNIARLHATAGRVDWRLVCVIDDADPPASFVSALSDVSRIYTGGGLGYWRALEVATRDTDAPLIVNLANDLLPGARWLERGLAAYRARFGNGDGLMGLNDGIHGPEQAPHFVISRRLLARYGGWPTWYHHNYGDTELCTRAQEEGCYGKAPWAVLYHDHHLTGAADDVVYAEGGATFDADAALFRQRRAAGWPHA